MAFDSYATNLVIGDTNEFMDVFLRDLGELSSLFLPLINH